MKLYYSPGARLLFPIALLEAGLPCELIKVDLRANKEALSRERLLKAA